MEKFCMAEGITFRYFEKSERNILENASLSFGQGEVAVLLGDSGCGKSTLAAVLCGLYPENGGYLESGTVIVDGRNMAGLSCRERSRYIAQMFQNPDLQFCMGNLRDELRFCLENACEDPGKMDGRIAAFAGEYGVEALLDRPFSELSGGEKQKAALCCMLLVDPKVLILDEPFANLDHASADRFLELLKKKGREGRTTVIAIDHQPENWAGIADRFLVLGEKGCVQKEYAGGELPPSDWGTDERPSGFKGEALPIVSLRGVSLYHGKHSAPVLREITGDICRGQITALLGPSGSGKTTLFLTLLGQKPYEGQITCFGEELRRIRKRELFRKQGIVFQNPGNQFISQTVLTEITESLRIWKGLAGEEAEAEARKLLSLYGLEKYARYSPYMLSQGQQRRLGVLSMLAGGQSLLLLDEPTYGQDRRATTAIMDQLRERTREGLSVIVSTHDEALAYRYADRIWRVKEGSIYEEA